jgi:4-amino-4-deoxy-L-arabinose transferase-like glycosyltransferase
VRLLDGAAGVRRCGRLAGGLALVLLCAAVYVPGLFSIPPVDRDESRFAQASRQMFEAAALPGSERDTGPFVRNEATGQVRAGAHAGGFAVPMVQDRPRLNKPPLIYWLQTGSAAALTGGDPSGDSIGVYRLPSALCALAAVLITWRLGCAAVGPVAGFLAAAMLAICPMVVWDAHQARADQLLLACTTAAMACLWSIWRSRHDQGTSAQRWLPALGLWLAIAGGLLAKGPITPMVVLFTALACSGVTGQWRWLARTKPLVGLAIVAACVGPWVWSTAQHVGWSTLTAIAHDELFARSTSAKESHWGPPGYHLVLSAALFWPGSLLTLAAVLRTWRLAVRLPPAESPAMGARLRSLPARWRARVSGRDDEVFLLAWLLPSWLVFELVATKLPHYPMPLYPALALLTAKLLGDLHAGRADTTTVSGLRLGTGIWLVIGVGFACVAPLGLALLGSPGWVLVVSAIVAAASAFLLWAARADADAGLLLQAHMRAGVACVLALAVVFGIVLPTARLPWVSARLAEVLPATGPVASVGFHEDSLVFLTRGRLERLDESDAIRWRRAHPAGTLIVPDPPPAELAGEHVRARVRGFNYSTGKPVSLVVLSPEIAP